MIPIDFLAISLSGGRLEARGARAEYEDEEGRWWQARGTGAEHEGEEHVVGRGCIAYQPGPLRPKHTRRVM